MCVRVLSALTLDCELGALLQCKCVCVSNTREADALLLLVCEHNSSLTPSFYAVERSEATNAAEERTKSTKQRHSKDGNGRTADSVEEKSRSVLSTMIEFSNFIEI